MARDGIATTRTAAPGGVRAELLRQILGATQLRVWTDLLGTDPAGVLGLPVTDGWRDTLLAGWAAAARAQADAAWAAALLPHLSPPARVELFDVVPRETREDAVAALLRARRPDHAAEALLNQALKAAPGPWGRRLSEAVLEWLARPVDGQRDAGQWYGRERLGLVERRLPPQAAPAVVAATAAAPPGSPWAAAVAGVADVLTFRLEMLEELQ